MIKRAKEIYQQKAFIFKVKWSELNNLVKFYNQFKHTPKVCHDQYLQDHIHKHEEIIFKIVKI